MTLTKSFLQSMTFCQQSSQHVLELRQETTTSILDMRQEATNNVQEFRYSFAEMQSLIQHLSQQLQEAVRSGSNRSASSASDSGMSTRIEEMKPPAPDTPKNGRKRPFGPDDQHPSDIKPPHDQDRAPDAGAK
jgi:sugar-specific transcriptional regulator TrmB